MNQDFFPWLSCLTDAFFRCLTIGDDQIQMFQCDAVADGTDIPFGIIQQQGAVAVVKESTGQKHLHIFFGREGQGCRQAGGDDGKREILRYHFHQLLDGGPGIQTYTAAGFQR